MSLLKRFIYFSFLFFCFSECMAQQANNWLFPFNNGITFNTPPPSIIGNSPFDFESFYSCATISDNYGNLLFSSDGSRVWDKNGNIMPNGSGLFGRNGTINTALIVPFVDDSLKFYLFVSQGTIGAGSNKDTCKYSYNIVDFSLNGGLGDISTKNVIIKYQAIEKMVALPDINGSDVWWVCRDWTNHFYSYKITCQGFQNNNPVVSTVGFNMNNNTNLLTYGEIKASPNGKLIAACNRDFFEIYQFNNATGLVYNSIKIPASECYGLEFSPNNKFLYITQRFVTNNIPYSSLTQYNITSYDSTSISNSLYDIYIAPTEEGGLQLGPNGKIYQSQAAYDVISVINNPNGLGANCNFQDSVFILPNPAYRRFPYSFANLITNQNLQITSSVAPDCRTVTLLAKTYIKGNTLSFKWKFGDGDSATQNVVSMGDTTFTTIVHTYPLGVDTFNVSLTVTSDTVCGQGRAGAKVVVKPPRPTAKFCIPIIACGQQQVQFTDSSLLNSNPSITHQWAYKAANSAGAFINFSTQPGPQFAFPALDSFSVRLIVSSALACVSSDTVIKTIYLKAKPTASFTAANTCGSLTASFTNNSSVAGDTLQSYQWDFGNSQSVTTKNPVFSFANYGSKTVQLTVTSSRGCSDTVVQTIAIKAKPTIGTGMAADSICAGTPFALSASALVDSATINSYQWQLNGTAIGTSNNFLNQTINTASVNRYTVLATSSEGCISDTAIILISIVGKPTAAFTAVNNCGSKTVAFTSTSTVVNDIIGQYWWSFGDGSNSTVKDPAKTYSNFSSGYTVQLVASSSKGCRSDTVTQTIPVKDKPTATLQYNGDACANTAFAITASSAVNNASISSHQWLQNGTAITNNSPTLTINQSAGNYRIQYLATSSEGCRSDTALQQLTIDAKPTAVFTTTNTCTQKNIVVNNSSTGNISRYKWQWGNGDSSLLQNPVYAYPIAGTYSITLQTTTANGCTAISTQPITIAAGPIANFTIAESCLGKTISISNNSSGSNYIWQSSDGQSSNATVPSFTYNTQGDYTIKLAVTGSFGCTDSSQQNFLVVPVAIGVAAANSIAIINQPVRLTATGAATYTWLPANLFSSNSGSSPIFRATNAGVYPITVTGITAQGCTGTAAIEIKVFATSAGLLLPNAFSPNGDGLNEVLRPICTGLQRLNYFQIYNRYGQLVYQQQQCGTSVGWDGTVKGKKQNAGAYIYTWQGVDFNGRAVSGKGTVVLVR
jgi:gliding motility-associated-like protein